MESTKYSRRAFIRRAAGAAAAVAVAPAIFQAEAAPKPVELLESGGLMPYIEQELPYWDDSPWSRKWQEAIAEHKRELALTFLFGV